LRVQRYAVGYEADVGYQSGAHQQFRGEFVLDDDPVALGFEYDADAIAFHIDLPEHGVLPDADEGPRERGFRAAWFSALINRDPALGGLTSGFQREQLERSYLACLVDEALGSNLDLHAARLRVGSAIHDRLVQAVDALFSTTDTLTAPARGLDELRALVRSPDVVTALDRVGESLWTPFGVDAYEWAKERTASTVAAVLSDAAQAFCPEFDIESESNVDVVDDTGDRRSIWFVESSPGGGGIVETLQQRLVTRPRHFVALLDRAVRPSDFEVVDRALRATLDVAVDSSRLAEKFSAFRDALTNDRRLECLRSIRQELGRLEIAATHPVVAALAARVLRPGSSRSTDEAIGKLAREWEAAEEHTRIELESSVFAFTQRRQPTYDALLASTPSGDVELRRIASIFATLWPRGWRARAEGLRVYSPYREFVPTDRLALERYRSIVAPAVDASAPGWRSEVDEQLRGRGITVVEAPSRQTLAQVIRELTVEPTDTGSLLLHPTVVAVDAAGQRVRASLVVGEGGTT
jgi:hypothetical protein